VVKEAMAEVTIQRSALFPAINVQANAQRVGAGSGAFYTTGQPIGVIINAVRLHSVCLHGGCVIGYGEVWRTRRGVRHTSQPVARRVNFMSVSAHPFGLCRALGSLSDA
jgi:hypothetical protein